MFEYKLVLTLSVLYFKNFMKKKINRKDHLDFNKNISTYNFQLKCTSKIIKYELKCTLLWRYVCCTEISKFL